MADTKSMTQPPANKVSAIEDLAKRIETNLMATDAPGMDVRFTMNGDAATAFMEQLRATSRLLEDHERLRSALEGKEREIERVQTMLNNAVEAMVEYRVRAEDAEAQLSTVREQALEEAAKVCETHALYYRGTEPIKVTPSASGDPAGLCFARAIRSLSSQEEGRA